jgi:hypothetical protein
MLMLPLALDDVSVPRFVNVLSPLTFTVTFLLAVTVIKLLMFTFPLELTLTAPPKS